MTLLGVRSTLLAAGLAVGACCVSCSHDVATSQTAAAFKKAKPGPEESFKVIEEMFRRRVAETPVGFVVSDPRRRSTMTGTNKVSAELIRPTGPADPFKAVITVESQSRYSIKRLKDNSDAKAAEKNANTSGDSPLSDSGVEKGVEVFDPTFSKPVEITSTHNTDDVIARRPDEVVRHYELLYENGRWTLVTELNKETEQSIQNAFKSALDTQI